MKVLIHACPRRMWYVTEFLVPNLIEQGADAVEVWNDEDGKGNLASCMECFASVKGDGVTWHIQDDVLPRRDFVERCRDLEPDRIVYGFCNEQFTDDPDQTGRVYQPDSWHSFQCVLIPDAYARECAEWFYSGEWKNTPRQDIEVLYNTNRGDDTFFQEFLMQRHGGDMVTNAKPNLVEHVDWIVGGSVLFPWRGYLSRAYYWDDEDLVKDLKQKVKGKVRYE